MFTNKFGQTKTLKFIITSTLIFVFILIFTENIIFSIVCIISLSGLTAMSSPIVLDIQNKFIRKNRATILSIYSMIGNIFAAIINILIGFLADMYVEYSFMLCFFILLLGVYGVYIYLSKTPKIETKIIRSK
ncbi:MAG: MFS transporter [Clostridiales bacterium]|nr:MFS transporter [Clostridiales bacterium]